LPKNRSTPPVLENFMMPAAALIPGLDEIVRGSDPKRRADAAHRISELFLQGAANFRADHVDLFDGVLISLVPHTELAARADLAERLSLLANAPRGLVGQLAHEDEIAIAGPLLRRSPVIDEKILVEIASMKGQGHLLAMAERTALSSDLTDVIVRRGDRDVVRRTAGNAGAAFSTDGYSTLIKRAGQDGVLTLKIGQRDDLSAEQLKDLLAGSIDVVRRRLFDHHRQAANGLRADDDVGDAGRALQNRIAFLLRDTPGDGDNRVVSVLHCELPQFAQARVELLFGAFPDAAGVDHDHIGIDRIVGRFEAGLFQEPGHALRVVDVHLAAERFDQVFTRHAPSNFPLCPSSPSYPAYFRLSLFRFRLSTSIRPRR